MIFKKPKQNTLNIVYKYRVLVYIVSISMLLFGLALLPFNPSDYFFPLSGVFVKAPNVLLGLFSLIFISVETFINQQIYYSAYKSIKNTFFTTGILFIIIMFLSFFRWFPSRIGISLMYYVYSFYILIKAFYLKNDTSHSFIDIITDLIFAIGLVVLGTLLITGIFGNGVLYELWMIAGICILLGGYLLAIMIFTDTKEKKKLKAVNVGTIIEIEEKDE